MKDTNLKVLISSKSFGKTDSDAIKLLINEGLEPVLNNSDKTLSEDEILSMASGAVGIIAGTEKITKKIITQSNSLKVISRYGVGIDNVDLSAAEEKGIKIYNTPGAPTGSVAELTLCLILNLYRKITFSDKNIRNNIWKPEIGTQLNGKKVGIIGLGKIGKRVVQLLQPFNVKFYAYEIKPNKKFNEEYNINVVTLDEMLKNCDVITIHLPLTNSTRHIIGKNEFLKMKKSAILINTARGDLIDEQSLYNSLKNKRIAGAGLDVFENEPYSGKLKELDNTILTPHIGSSTVETRRIMDFETVNNMINGLKEAGIL